MATDADALASAVASCMAMRPAEIKAELDLRKIPHGDLFEKAELASRLARARIAGALACQHHAPAPRLVLALRGPCGAAPNR